MTEGHSLRMSEGYSLKWVRETDLKGSSKRMSDGNNDGIRLRVSEGNGFTNDWGEKFTSEGNSLQVSEVNGLKGK